jgi:hypothetical protein
MMFQRLLRAALASIPAIVALVWMTAAVRGQTGTQSGEWRTYYSAEFLAHALPWRAAFRLSCLLVSLERSITARPTRPGSVGGAQFPQQRSGR